MTPDPKSTFLAAIHKRGIRSLRELAARSNLSHSILSMWVCGKRNLSHKAADRVATALGTTRGKLTDLFDVVTYGKVEEVPGLHFREKDFIAAWTKIRDKLSDLDMSNLEAFAVDYFTPLARHYVNSRHCHLRHCLPDEAVQTAVIRCCRKISKYNPEKSSAFNYFTRICQNAILDIEATENKWSERHVSVDSGDECEDGNRAAVAIAILWANGKMRTPDKHVAKVTGLTLDNAREHISALSEEAKGCVYLRSPPTTET